MTGRQVAFEIIRGFILNLVVLALCLLVIGATAGVLAECMSYFEAEGYHDEAR